jgi:hypothetical protein
MSGRPEVISQSCITGGGGVGPLVGLPSGKLTTSATLSTFQLSLPRPPPKLVEIVTLVMSLTCGAAGGRFSIDEYVEWLTRFKV